MTATEDLDLILKTMANTIVANTDYFCELDQVVGDGDFGYSLRSGFEVVQAELETFDHSNVGALLKKVGFVISSKVGGSSGPIWGTAFLRAAKEAGERIDISHEEVIAILRAAVTGIMDRGGASLGEKTLLDGRRGDQADARHARAGGLYRGTEHRLSRRRRNGRRRHLAKHQRGMA